MTRWRPTPYSVLLIVLILVLLLISQLVEADTVPLKASAPMVPFTVTGTLPPA